MTKWFTALLLSALMAVPALGATIRQGAYEIKAEIGSEIPTTDDTQTPAFSGGMGYYPADNILVGGFVSYQKLAWDSYWGVGPLWGLGAFGEYQFDVADNMLPFVGLSVGLYDSDNESDTKLIFTPSVGIKYLVTERMALSAQLLLSLASDDVFDFKRDQTDSHTTEVGATDEIHGSGHNAALGAAIGVRFLY